MITAFPKFSKLSLDDREELQKHITRYPPHSDFNLAGLWSYDTDEVVEVSLLNSNLVMQSRDYLTKESFFAFLGTRETDKTIDKIFEFIGDRRGLPQVKLLTEKTIQSLRCPEANVITEDRDNFDYVFSARELQDMAGTKYLKKRNKINAFQIAYGNDAKVEATEVTKKTEGIINELFDQWKRQKNRDDDETAIELKALQRLLAASKLFRIFVTLVYVKQVAIAFSINEVVQQNTGIIHFEKADVNYKGIYEYLKQQGAAHFLERGCTQINYEQDLGIAGLREAKMSFRPVRFEKKYTVRPK